ncbi:hypothetical protein MG293_010594 [Ovis ammon polii]|uniref:Uncharacterized protein n=1 Tax=Ovis ammon polii TaxID=230172 RepID=A0AAD4Y9L9_OVIAM|nr:hypothetical protein MG293_010594 [Ovis ammon polii]
MAEAGRSPAEPPGEPAGQAAAEEREPETPAGPPAPALRRLPGDPSPRGRSQSDLSSCSSRGRPLRVHISGSVDGNAERFSEREPLELPPMQDILLQDCPCELAPGILSVKAFCV